jgi:DNA-binding FadR family transcriptional regulator
MIHFIQQHTDIYQAIRLHDPEASDGLSAPTLLPSKSSSRKVETSFLR